MAGTIDNALNLYGNALRGTASQRAAFLSTAADGMLWQDTDGVRMIWRKDGAAWVPAVLRWRGTAAQMNSFGANAPDGFEWFNTTDSNEYVRLSSAWVKAPPTRTLQTLTGTLSAGFSGTVQYAITGGTVMIVAILAGGSVPAGSATDLFSGIPSELRPTENRHGAALLSGGYTGTVWVRSNGTIAVAQSTGATRNGPQFTITYLYGV